MSIFEFLERLEADPFDPEIIALFDAEAAQSASNAFVAAEYGGIAKED